jgi:hypothetical protein
MPAEEISSCDAPRVAMIYELPPPKDYLQDALAEVHIPLAATCRVGELDSLELTGTDVILVTIDEAMEPYLERITEFVADTSLPVVFEESDVSRHLDGWDRNRWLRHLRAKILGSSDTRPTLPAHAANETQMHASEEAVEAFPVWVLGASIGGPESVRRFLEALPADVPAAFLLVQHMGAEFQRVLADRLSRVTDLDVVCAADGESLKAGRVIVVPVDSNLSFDADSRMRLSPLDSTTRYEPSLDRVLIETTRQFGDRVGAVVFSGQAHDGVDGCAEVRRRGGMVWTQDAASASISTIADGIREAGLSQYDAAPEQLAAHLRETLAAARASTHQDKG